MTKVLLVLQMPEELRMPYFHGIRGALPHITLNIVGHSNEAGPFIAEADVLVTFGTHVSDEILAEAKNLKWVQLLSTGVDAIVSRPSLGKEVIITNVPGIHASSVSEAAIMFMLALSRDLPRAVHDKDRHVWDRWSSPILQGKTVGILGMGLIAEGLAPRCKALGMRVVGITTAPRSVAGFDAVHDRDALLDVVPSLDYLVVLTPYTKATHALINDAVFAAMKPKSYFVNLARGKIVDERALIAALELGPARGRGNRCGVNRAFAAGRSVVERASSDHHAAPRRDVRRIRRARSPRFQREFAPLHRGRCHRHDQSRVSRERVELLRVITQEETWPRSVISPYTQMIPKSWRHSMSKCSA